MSKLEGYKLVEYSLYFGLKHCNGSSPDSLSFFVFWQTQIHSPLSTNPPAGGRCRHPWGAPPV